MPRRCSTIASDGMRIISTHDVLEGDASGDSAAMKIWVPDEAELWRLAGRDLARLTLRPRE